MGDTVRDSRGSVGKRQSRPCTLTTGLVCLSLSLSVVARDIINVPFSQTQKASHKGCVNAFQRCLLLNVINSSLNVLLPLSPAGLREPLRIFFAKLRPDRNLLSR